MLHKLHCIFFNHFYYFLQHFLFILFKLLHIPVISLFPSLSTFVSSFPLCFSTYYSHLSLPLIQLFSSIILPVPLPTEIQVFPRKQTTFQIKSTCVTFFCMGFIYIILNIHVSGISASVILTETQST